MLLPALIQNLYFPSRENRIMIAAAKKIRCEDISVQFEGRDTMDIAKCIC